MKIVKKIALVAHDKKKIELLAWAVKYQELLLSHELYATGTTGTLLEEHLGITVHKVESGPLGGDLQLGAKIVERIIDVLIFFWDPLESQPHDPDIKALLRIAVVWNIPVACNEATANIIITSDFMHSSEQNQLPNYSDYHKRII